MPEIPDLLYTRGYLERTVIGRTITEVSIPQPVVVRVIAGDNPKDLLRGRQMHAIETCGPFLRFRLGGSLSLILNLMLAGRLQHQLPGSRADGYCCLSLSLDDGSRLNLSDSKRMAKAYVVPDDSTAKVPRFGNQGIDILSGEFTLPTFRLLVDAHRRKQVRVFLNDQRVLSAIGNAYADEILFDARIHPKTFLGKLGEEGQEALWGSIRSVMQWGIEEVRKAGQPIEVKVRDHMRVRNRKGEPCPRCATTIRREGVRGYDVFFCPSCQPATRELFLDWRKIKGDI